MPYCTRNITGCQKILCHTALEVLRVYYLKRVPKDKILYRTKLKEFADDNFEFDGKVSKRLENTEGKGEIALYEQYLLFSQCFQKTCAADT